MEIRNFQETDRSSVISLWRSCDLVRPWNDPDKDIDRKMSYQPDLFFVGVIGSEIIASAMAGYDGHRGSVFYLAVSPNHQAQGYGQSLMHYIEQALIKIGCPKLNIVIRSSNERVFGFYNNQSYEPDDVVSIGKRLIPDV